MSKGSETVIERQTVKLLLGLNAQERANHVGLKGLAAIAGATPTDGATLRASYGDDEATVLDALEALVQAGGAAGAAVASDAVFVSLVLLGIEKLITLRGGELGAQWGGEDLSLNDDLAAQLVTACMHDLGARVVCASAHATARLANAITGLAAEEFGFTSSEDRVKAELQAAIDTLRTDVGGGIDLRRPLVSQSALNALRSDASLKAGLRAVQRDHGLRFMFINRRDKQPASLASGSLRKMLDQEFGVKVLVYGDSAAADPRLKALEADLAYYAAPLFAAAAPKPLVKAAAVPKVFVSYAHHRHDQKWFELLLQHLKGLQLAGKIDIWTDLLIWTGREWSAAIGQAMEEAHVAVLLVSPAFMASDYCINKELKRLVEREKAGGLRVLPLLARKCTFQVNPWLEAHQMLDKARPLASMGSRADSALAGLCQTLYQPPP